jgi:hypothetical protein
MSYGVRFLAGTRIFLHQYIQTGFGFHPASYPMALKSISSGVMQLKHDTNHSPIYSTGLQLTAVLHSYRGVVYKDKDNFPFPFKDKNIVHHIYFVQLF